VEVIRRVRSKIELLASTGFAEMGRRGREHGTREFIVAPYIIAYEVHCGETNSSFSVLSTAQ
jgi:hypothetical protein